MLITTLLEFTAVMYSFKGYLRTKYINLLFMTVSWSLLTLINVGIVISFLFMNSLLYRLSLVLVSPLAFSIIFLIDSISRESIDSKKIFVITFISAILLLFSFDDDSVTINKSWLNEYGLVPAHNFLIAVGSISFLTSVLWLYYLLKIYINAPDQIKKYSLISVIGGSISGLGSELTYFFGLILIIPGIDYIFISIGALFCAYAFNEQPKLAYVLRFKVMRLVVNDLDLGLPIYTYSWSSSYLDDVELFSGALQSVCTILDESLHQGTILRIVFSQGELIFHHLQESRLLFLLITTKNNQLLNQGLKLFASSFSRIFKDKIHTSPIEKSEFFQANRLIDECFPFIPKYD